MLRASPILRESAHTMIDHGHKKNKPETLTQFAPVPRHYNRHDGWTAERQRGFIEALADTGSVKAAAHAVNMAPEGAYQLRRHPEGREFRKAWEAALKCGIQRLEDVAMDRALNGVEMPVYYHGELIGTHRKYNDRLLMFLLRNRARTRFAEGRLNAADDGVLKRLRKEWRKQWEKERAIEDEEQHKEDEAELEETVEKWERMATERIAVALRAEWLRLGGPPPISQYEVDEWNEAEDAAAEEEEEEEEEED